MSRKDRTMIWPLKQWWFMSRLFVCQVLLLTVDVITDFENAMSLLKEERPSRAHQTGQGLLIFIFMPGMWAALALLLSLLGSNDRQKSSLKLPLNAFKEFIEALPVFNILSKFLNFLRLCFIDTGCPHNFGRVSHILYKMISSSLNEAFLESAPQLVIQASFLIYSFDKHRKIETLFILGIASSLLSCSLASVNLFMFGRPDYYSDCCPSWKIVAIIFPLVLISIMGGISLWSSACAIALDWAGVAFLIMLSTSFSLAFCYWNKSKRPKFLLNEIVSCWIAPFAPWRPKTGRNVEILFLKIVGAAAVPVTLILIGGQGWGKDLEYGSYLGMAGICIGSFFVCMLVHILGSYKNIYAASKALKLFKLKPVVHRSMIIDLLKDQDAENDGRYPDFFYTFLDDPDEINQPEPEHWNTVMHFAFDGQQFDALVKMIQHGGNPFVRNKAGQSIESMLESLSPDQSSIKKLLLSEIENFKLKFPPQDQESLVHSAARNNRLKLLKVYRLLNASLDSFNYKRQKPLEVAMESGHLESSLYLMQSMPGIFQDQDIGQECFKFLREQASSSAFSAPLALNYIQVIQSCLKLQEFDAKEIEKLEEELKTSKENFNEMLFKILSRDPSI